MERLLFLVMRSWHLPVSLFYVAGGATLALTINWFYQPGSYGWSDISAATIGGGIALGFALESGVMRLLSPGGLRPWSLAIAAYIWWVGAYYLSYMACSYIAVELPTLGLAVVANDHIGIDALCFASFVALLSFWGALFREALAKDKAPMGLAWAEELPALHRPIGLRDIVLVLAVTATAAGLEMMLLFGWYGTNVERHARELIVTFHQFTTFNTWTNAFWIYGIILATASLMLALRVLDGKFDCLFSGFKAGPRTGMLYYDRRRGEGTEQVQAGDTVQAVIIRAWLAAPDGRRRLWLSTVPVPVEVLVADEAGEACYSLFTGLRKGDRRLVVTPVDWVSAQLRRCGVATSPDDRYAFVAEISSITKAAVATVEAQQ
jgi:hypothetical protein